MWKYSFTKFKGFLDSLGGSAHKTVLPFVSCAYYQTSLGGYNEVILSTSVVICYLICSQISQTFNLS